MTLLREALAALQRRDTIVLASTVLYVLAFILVPPSIRGPVFILSLFPVGLAGGLYGRRGGVLAAFVGIPVHGLIVLTGLAELSSLSLGGLIVGTGTLLPLGAGVGWLTDSQRALRRTEAELRVSEARFRTIFEHAPIGITFNPHSQSTTGRGPEASEWTWNRRYEEIVGRSTEAIRQARHGFTHPDDHAEQESLRACTTLIAREGYAQSEAAIACEGG
ncbi:MAG: hypothetical protein CL878_14150, partial [Dehalococcoidia bacterium]|nr:hypothetical protein [Dehalococcoidia bacterium]